MRLACDEFYLINKLISYDIELKNNFDDIGMIIKVQSNKADNKDGIQTTNIEDTDFRYNVDFSDDVVISRFKKKLTVPFKDLKKFVDM